MSDFGCSKLGTLTPSDDGDAATPSAAPTPAGTGTPSEVEPEMSKRDKRRAREAKKKLQAEHGDGGDDGQQVCNVCNEKFTSRTKLFDHVKREGHMLAPGQGDGGKGKRGKGSKR